MKLVLIFLLLITFNVLIFSQEIETEIHDPFITAYQNYGSDCIYSYDDLIVYHPDWGIVLFDKDDNGEIVELSRLYCDIYYPCVRQ